VAVRPVKVAAEYPVGIRQLYLLGKIKSTGVISHSYLKRSFEVHKLFSFRSELERSPRRSSFGRRTTWPDVIPAHAGIQGRRGSSRTARKVSLREVLPQKGDEAISATGHQLWAISHHHPGRRLCGGKLLRRGIIQRNEPHRRRGHRRLGV